MLYFSLFHGGLGEWFIYVWLLGAVSTLLFFVVGLLATVLSLRYGWLFVGRQRPVLVFCLALLALHSTALTFYQSWSPAFRN